MKSNFCPSCGVKFLKFNATRESCDSCGVKLKVNFQPFKKWGIFIFFSGWLMMISSFTSNWILLFGITGMLIGVVGVILDKSSQWIVDDR